MVQAIIRSPKTMETKGGLKVTKNAESITEGNAHMISCAILNTDEIYNKYGHGAHICKKGQGQSPDRRDQYQYHGGKKGNIITVRTIVMDIGGSRVDM